MKSYIKILLTACALVVIANTTVKALEKDIVSAKIRNLGKQFKNAGYQDEQKWIKSLDGIRSISDFQSRISGRIDKMTADGKKAEGLVRDLSLMSGEELLKDYLAKLSPRPSSDGPSSEGDNPVLSSAGPARKKLVETLVSANKESIKLQNYMARKYAEIAGKYSAAIRSFTK